MMENKKKEKDEWNSCKTDGKEEETKREGKDGQ